MPQRPTATNPPTNPPGTLARLRDTFGPKAVRAAQIAGDAAQITGIVARVVALGVAVAAYGILGNLAKDLKFGFTRLLPQVLKVIPVAGRVGLWAGKGTLKTAFGDSGRSVAPRSASALEVSDFMPGRRTAVLAGGLGLTALSFTGVYKFLTSDFVKSAASRTATAVKKTKLAHRFQHLPTEYHGEGFNTHKIYCSLPVDTYQQRLRKAQIMVESNGYHFDPKTGFKEVLTGGAGEKGFSQLTPGRASALSDEMGLTLDSWLDPFQNLKMGDYLTNKYWGMYKGIPEMVLMGYNGGEGYIARRIKNVGDPRKGEVSGQKFGEVSDYVKHVLAVERNQQWARANPRQAASWIAGRKQRPEADAEELAVQYSGLRLRDMRLEEWNARKALVAAAKPRTIL